MIRSYVRHRGKLVHIKVMYRKQRGKAIKVPYRGLNASIVFQDTAKERRVMQLRHVFADARYRQKKRRSYPQNRRLKPYPIWWKRRARTA